MDEVIIKSYKDLESECEKIFINQGKIWHLYTPGDSTEVLFRDDNDYVAVMNMVAISAFDTPNVRILTFEVMSNHFHFIITGEREPVLEFFEILKRRISRYIANSGRYTKVLSLEPGLKLVPDLKTVRVVIPYVNRNAFVVSRNVTPFSYPWGANMYYYNPVTRLQERTYFSQLNQKRKREICRSHKCNYPDDWYITNGYISPLCYCDINTGERLFRTAHHYFSFVSKPVEAYSEVAKDLGDKVFLTDDEVYLSISSIAYKKYGERNPMMLGANQKMELARTMHFDYFSSNKQIARILKLNINILESMFPKVK